MKTNFRDFFDICDFDGLLFFLFFIPIQNLLGQPVLATTAHDTKEGIFVGPVSLN